MDLKKLFEMQKKLDKKIIKEKGLEGQYLLDKKILALQVELGELANEARFFKFWSNDQEPRTKARKECEICDGYGEYTTGIFDENSNICEKCEGTGFGEYKNPLLEEYVDSLHFILSIGNEFECADLTFTDFLHREDTITKQFKYVFYTIASIDECLVCKDMDDVQEMYGYLFGGFSVLGKLLGFTWEQIEKAYFEKNKVNHERQANGY